MLLDQVYPVVHFGNSASVLHEATLDIDILYGKAPPQSLFIPLCQNKPQVVCCRERLRVIVFDKTAILSSERDLKCTNTLCFDEVSKYS